MCIASALLCHRLTLLWETHRDHLGHFRNQRPQRRIQVSIVNHFGDPNKNTWKNHHVHTTDDSKVESTVSFSPATRCHARSFIAHENGGWMVFYEVMHSQTAVTDGWNQGTPQPDKRQPEMQGATEPLHWWYQGPCCGRLEQHLSNFLALLIRSSITSRLCVYIYIHLHYIYIYIIKNILYCSVWNQIQIMVWYCVSFYTILDIKDHYRSWYPRTQLQLFLCTSEATTRTTPAILLRHTGPRLHVELVMFAHEPSLVKPLSPPLLVGQQHCNHRHQK